MISVRTHSICDYIIGVLLIACPNIFGFADLPEARMAFFWSGVLLIVYSCFTKYGNSILKLLPIWLHMKLDIAVGLWLILAPSILGYRLLISPNLLGLHIVLGFLVIFYVGITHYRHDESIAETKVTLDSGGFHLGGT